MPDLSYNDKKSLLASALGVSTYSIKDFTDSVVIYYDDKSEKLYGRGYSLVDGKFKLDTPQMYATRTVYEPVTSLGTFSLEGDVEFSGDEVVLTGKVFEAGDYADKGFSITPQEIATAAAEFAPVPNDLEHKPTILSGKIGQLRSVVASGKDLIGKVAVPKWLYEAAGSGPIKASLAWNKATKRIVGNALVLNPRVPDAQLVAAFTAANSHEGGKPEVLIVNGKPEEKKPGSRDIANGDALRAPSWFERLKALFSAKQLPEGMEDFDPEAVRFSEDPQPAPEKKPDEPASGTPTPPAPTAQMSEADQARFAAQQQELAGLRAAQVQTHAEKFFADAVAAGKVFPSEKDALIAQFKQAVLDDNSGTVCFSADGTMKEGVRVKALRDAVQARPAHNLTAEQLAGVDPKGLVVLSAETPGGSGMTDARRRELLGAGQIQVKEGK